MNLIKLHLTTIIKKGISSIRVIGFIVIRFIWCLYNIIPSLFVEKVLQKFHNIITTVV